ncbi:hypothetical protein [Chitinophaga tropicalis]|uniref:Carboxypeptidase regulatory-like domain-containing protein n=1 Tax=Chitinophaga tropicalis TaxID=2683588 RepID=A0A7K1TYN5_9BACT|nr:hypothetical protein [Chitinophaga tropicalis]MVT07202.1 hypothetical protein [Chitinophaga tropicalis]
MHWLRLSLLLLFTFTSCKKYMSYEGVPPIQEEPSQTVTTSIQGRILNGQRQPVADAGVTGGGRTVTTDADGNFLLENISINNNAAVVTASKSGYFTSYRTLIVRESNLHYTQLELLHPGQNTYNAGDGSVITFSGGTLSFPPSSLLSADKSTYSGITFVQSSYIDPSDNTFADQMPGDLRGIDDNKQQTGIRAFCMLALEVKGEDGNLLSFDGTKPVTFRAKIPSALGQDAPAEIPLWLFDPASGKWTRKGSAQKQGTDYTGTLTQNGYWACGTTFQLVTLNTSLVTPAGAPVPNLLTAFMIKIGLVPMYCYSDSAGRITAKVPADALLLSGVMDRCNNVFLLKELGPYGAKTQEPPITVTFPDNRSLTINGTVLNCNNAPVNRGNVILSIDGLKYIIPINLGYFRITVPRCDDASTTASLTAIESGTLSQSVTTINVSSGTITPAIIICPQ